MERNRLQRHHLHRGHPDIDQEQYEAAKVDGAGRIQQIMHVTIPGIWSIVLLMFILRLGSILQAGPEHRVDPSALEAGGDQRVQQTGESADHLGKRLFPPEGPS